MGGGSGQGRVARPGVCLTPEVVGEFQADRAVRGRGQDLGDEPGVAAPATGIAGIAADAAPWGVRPIDGRPPAQIAHMKLKKEGGAEYERVREAIKR